MSKFKDEDKEISNHLLCKVCKQFLTEPFHLPCSGNICLSHSNDLIRIDQENNKKYFDCVFCKEKHFIEKDAEFSLNDEDQKRDLVQLFEKLKYYGSNSKLEDFKRELENYFTDLRSMVDLRREDVILEIHKASSELSYEVNVIKNDYLNKLEQTRSDFEEQKVKVKNYEKKLKEYKVDLNEWAKIKEDIKQDLTKLDQIKENVNKLVASKEKIQIKEDDSSDDTNFKNLFGRIEKILTGRLISVSNDNLIKIWDLEYGQCIKTINAHGNYVSCLELLDNHKFASGSNDETIKIWDFESFECLKTLNGHSGCIYCIRKVNENEIISGSEDQTIKIWNINSGDCLKTLQGYFSVLTRCLEITNDKNSIISCSDDKKIKIWNYENGECLRTLIGHSNYINCLALINKKIISGSFQTIIIWNIDSGECLETLNAGHNYWVTCVKPFKENQFLSGSSDGFIKLWEIENGSCLKTIKAHDDLILVLEISEQGLILSGSNENSMKIWHIESGECLKTFSGYSSPIRSLILNS